MPLIRLQKILAQAGLGSRRACEAYLLAGRVNVNGKVAELGMKADPAVDRITLDGEPLGTKESLIYIMLNKPPGVLSSLRSQGGLPTILDLVAVNERVFPVGRLDKNSEGLLLLTNDGELANLLTHPRFEHEKSYRLLLNRKPTPDEIENWRGGLTLPDGFKTGPAQVWIERSEGRKTWLGVILKEGHKRQLRESARVLGLRVHRLIRIRFGTLELANLKPGAWRYLRPDEVQGLKAAATPR
jgi:23S rRNA pseudouridine2605 synthase